MPGTARDLTKRDLTLRAGNAVIFRNGFSVEVDGILTVSVD
jgi:hypothetical protein